MGDRNNFMAKKNLIVSNLMIKAFFLPNFKKYEQQSNRKHVQFIQQFNIWNRIHF